MCNLIIPMLSNADIVQTIEKVISEVFCLIGPIKTCLCKVNGAHSFIF